MSANPQRLAIVETLPRIPQSTRHFYLNRETCLARSRAWYAANREKMRERSRAYHAAHKAEIAARKKQRAEEDPESVKAIHRRYSHRHPEVIRAKSHVRRARLRGGGGKYTVAEWQALCEQYGGRCLACGVIPDLLTVDHVRPISLGGKNTIDNIQPLCGSCNFRKSTREIDYRPAFAALCAAQGGC